MSVVVRALRVNGELCTPQAKFFRKYPMQTAAHALEITNLILTIILLSQPSCLGGVYHPKNENKTKKPNKFITTCDLLLATTCTLTSCQSTNELNCET